MASFPPRAHDRTACCSLAFVPSRSARLVLLGALCWSAVCVSRVNAQSPAPTTPLAEPLSPLALVARGDSAWKAGDQPRALKAYQEVVRRDPELSSRAVFRLATLLSYDNRLDEAIALFHQYVRMEPQDDEGRIALARTMGWAGRYDDAIAVYDTILARDSTYRDAAKGIARVLAWRGDLANSEIRWRALTQSTPRDADAWVGLAQVLRWNGRPVAARAALQRALAIDPQHGEANAQLRWVDAELRPTLQLQVTPTNDSDHNSAIWYAATAGLQPPWNGRFTLMSGMRVTSFQNMRARSAGARAQGRWSFGVGQWTAGGELGFTHLSGTVGGADQNVSRPTRLVAAANIRTLISPRVNIGIGGSYAPFDETAQLILNGITMGAGNIDLSLTLPARLTFDASGGVARITDGATPNTRRSGLAVLRYALSRAFSAAATVRGFGYDTVATDGYFSPELYLLSEGSLRARFGNDLGWRATADAGLGSQRVRMRGITTSRLATRGNLDVGYQFAPGYGISLSGTLANLPSARTIDANSYHWYSFGITMHTLLP